MASGLVIQGTCAPRFADVLLLSEVDWGMARTGNRFVARDMAIGGVLAWVLADDEHDSSTALACEPMAPVVATHGERGRLPFRKLGLERTRGLDRERRRGSHFGERGVDALPHARLCITCKEKEEDGKRR